MRLACIAYRLCNNFDEFYTTGPLSVMLHDTLQELLIDYKAENMEIVSGLNPGQDMILPWIADEHKLPVTAILPYTMYGGAADGWTQYDQTQFKQTLLYSKLTITYSSSGQYKPWKEAHKNKRIIEISDIIVFFGEHIEIDVARKFAKQQNKEIFTFNLPKEEAI